MPEGYSLHVPNVYQQKVTPYHHLVDQLSDHSKFYRKELWALKKKLFFFWCAFLSLFSFWSLFLNFCFWCCLYFRSFCCWSNIFLCYCFRFHININSNFFSDLLCNSC